jgi:hypothetical protein
MNVTPSPANTITPSMTSVNKSDFTHDALVIGTRDKEIDMRHPHADHRTDPQFEQSSQLAVTHEQLDNKRCGPLQRRYLSL